MTQILLRLPDVKARTGLGRSSIYAFMKAGTFPKHVKLGQRSVGWLETDVQEWVAARIADSREKAAENASA